MDTFSLVTGLLVLALAVFPMLLIRMSRKKEEKKRTLALNALAAKHQSSISESENMFKIMLGVDATKTRLFFMRFDENPSEEVVELTDVQSCSILELKDISERVTRLSMVFHAKNGKQSELNLFDANTQIRLDGEKQFALKWKEKLGF